MARLVIKAVWVSLMVLTPLSGFWLASSLAAYENGSPWLRWSSARVVSDRSGRLGADDRVAAQAHREQAAPDPPRSARAAHVDRQRAVPARHPVRAPDRAPRNRGPWRLDARRSRGADREQIRGVLLGIADHVNRRWHEAHEANPTRAKPPGPFDDGSAPVGATRLGATNVWPVPAAPDVQVTGMPRSVQTSVAAVGKYLAERIADKRRLVKALHDFVVLRLDYDVATARLSGDDRFTAPVGKRPSQRAVDVFTARRGVCEGYARLMVALGKAAGIEIAYITGFIREAGRHIDGDATDDAVKASLEGSRHAWNAVKVDGQWLLVDATWDNPVGGKRGPDDRVLSTYLMTPPHLFRLDHLPEETAWQLSQVPLSAGEFARQPLLGPRIGELGITLEQPTRSKITVDHDLEIRLDNPRHAALTVIAKPVGRPRRRVHRETRHRDPGQGWMCARTWEVRGQHVRLAIAAIREAQPRLLRVDPGPSPLTGWPVRCACTPAPVSSRSRVPGVTCVAAGSGPTLG